MSAEANILTNQEKTEKIRSHIKQTLTLLKREDQIFEVRMLKVGDYGQTVAGFFDHQHIDECTKGIMNYHNSAKGIYIALNEFPRELLSWSANRFKTLRKDEHTISDNHITRRQWLLIDVDPKRLSKDGVELKDIPSSDEEHERARVKLLEIAEHLKSQGWSEPIIIDSGNGYHALFAIDLPNTPEATELVKKVLVALAQKFDDNFTEVDRKVFNAARITKLPGTIAKKGDPISDRPHRFSQLISTPETINVVSSEQLQAIAATIIIKETKEPEKANRADNVFNFSSNHSKSEIVLDSARKYLFSIPGAIQGQHGSDVTYYAACVLINGFALSFNEALPLLLEWNSTCEPPWSNSELEHKLRDAEQKDSTKPKGYLLKQNDSSSAVKWNDECLSDADLEEISIHDLKRNNLVRIRGQKWIGQVNKINDREITVYFKNKNALVPYDISELVWKNNSKNCVRSNVLPTSNHHHHDFSDPQPNNGNYTQPEESQNDTNEPTNPSPNISEQELFFLISSIYPSLDDGELGDAKLFAHIFQDELVFDHSIEKWYRYNGVYWQLDEINNVILLVAENLTKHYQVKKVEIARAKSSPSLSDDQKKEIKSLVENIEKRIAVLKSIARVGKVLKFAESILGITSKVWDVDPWLLAVSNGVLDLRTGELLEGNPTDYIKTVSSTEWKGLNETCPRFERFLLEILDNKSDRDEIIAALNRLLGYGITGRSTEHVFPIFFGEGGRNGKDTLFETLGYVLGSVASSGDRDCLIESRRDTGSATPYLRELKGKRLVWVSETRKGARLNVAQVKYITGGGRIKARNLNENLIEFDPTHTMCLLTNYKPHIDAEDNAIWERLILLSFDLTFTEEPIEANERLIDTNLREVLKQETSGILAWLVRGCLEWQQKGLKIPVSMKQAKLDYRENEDTLGLFIKQCCVKDDNATISAQDLYGAYKEWSEQNKHMPINGNDFSQRMGKRVTKLPRTNKGIFYKGITLAQQS